jgi:cation diffusion facilitator CzcD-associated flavoprotein CzcO
MDPQRFPVSPAAVAVIGTGAAAMQAANDLRQAAIADVVILAQQVSSSLFDDDTDTWMLETSAETYYSRVVVAADEQTFVPWVPDQFRDSDFQGRSVHSRAWDPALDVTGKRIAVVGGDAIGGRLIDDLLARGAAVKVFGLPPRRIVPVLTRHRVRIRRQRSADLVTSPVDSVTATGIRTRDGDDHDVDVIVYGTGLSIRDELSPVRPAWRDGMEPYAGVAVHGFPNYFWLTGPDHDTQLRHIVECLHLMHRTRATRIEVRRSSQQVFNERVHLRPLPHHPVAHAYDVSSGADREEHAYDGMATLTFDDADRRVRVRLTGHVDPLDGHYHWQGTVFDPLPSDLLRRSRQVMLDAGARSAPARITEQTPQGVHSIAGVGAPPFAVNGAELAVPRL